MSLLHLVDDPAAQPIGREDAYYHEAELTLLGSLLINVTHVPEVSRLIGAEHFGHIPHQIIYKAILRTIANADRNLTSWRERTVMDVMDESQEFLMQLLTELRRSGLLAQSGGILKLAELSDYGIYTCDLPWVTGAIIESWQNRQLSDAVNDLGEGVATPEARARALQERIIDILEATPSRTTKSAQNLSEEFEGWLRQKPDVRSLVRTYTRLDRHIGDLVPGFVTGIAARASTGKTTFLMQTAVRNAACGIPTLVLSLEMPPARLWGRLVCNLAGVDGIELINKRGENLSPAEWDRVAAAQGKAHTLPIYIPDVRRNAPMDDLWRIVDFHMREHNVRFVAVDHLRLIRGEGKGEHERQTDRISRLSDMAADIRLPVLCAMQINREGGKADRPSLHHLEGSGAIEQDCETVIILHAASPDGGEDRLEIEAIVAKARDGKTGTVTLPWSPAYYRIDHDYFAQMQTEIEP